MSSTPISSSTVRYYRSVADAELIDLQVCRSSCDSASKALTDIEFYQTARVIHRYCRGLLKNLTRYLPEELTRVGFYEVLDKANEIIREAQRRIDRDVTKFEDLATQGNDTDDISILQDIISQIEDLDISEKLGYFKAKKDLKVMPDQLLEKYHARITVLQSHVGYIIDRSPAARLPDNKTREERPIRVIPPEFLLKDSVEKTLAISKLWQQLLDETDEPEVRPSMRIVQELWNGAWQNYPEIHETLQSLAIDYFTTVDKCAKEKDYSPLREAIDTTLETLYESIDVELHGLNQVAMATLKLNPIRGFQFYNYFDVIDFEKSWNKAQSLDDIEKWIQVWLADAEALSPQEVRQKVQEKQPRLKLTLEATLVELLKIRNLQYAQIKEMLAKATQKASPAPEPIAQVAYLPDPQALKAESEEIEEMFRKIAEDNTKTLEEQARKFEEQRNHRSEESKTRIQKTLERQKEDLQNIVDTHRKTSELSTEDTAATAGSSSLKDKS